VLVWKEDKEKVEEKSESLDKFKTFESMVEDEMDLKTKCLRSDRGGEFTSKEFDIFYECNSLYWNLLSI
jgi:hypothetical protein